MTRHQGEHVLRDRMGIPVGDQTAALVRMIRESVTGDGPAVRMGLALAVTVWLNRRRDGVAALRWSLVGTAANGVLEEMFAGAPDYVIEFDPDGYSDDEVARQAVAEVITAVADVLHASACDHCGLTGHRWAVRLRDAIKVLP